MGDIGPDLGQGGSAHEQSEMCYRSLNVLASPCEVLLNFVERLLGEILVDLGDDASFDVAVQIVTQIGSALTRSL